MSNKSSSHKHGHAFTTILRKKSKLSNRRNKIKSTIRREERFKNLDKYYKEALSKIS